MKKYKSKQLIVKDKLPWKKLYDNYEVSLNNIFDISELNYLGSYLFTIITN